MVYTVERELVGDGRYGHAVYGPDGRRVGPVFDYRGGADKLASDLNAATRRAVERDNASPGRSRP